MPTAPPRTSKIEKRPGSFYTDPEESKIGPPTLDGREMGHYTAAGQCSREPELGLPDSDLLPPETWTERGQANTAGQKAESDTKQAGAVESCDILPLGRSRAAPAADLRSVNAVAEALGKAALYLPTGCSRAFRFASDFEAPVWMALPEAGAELDENRLLSSPVDESVGAYVICSGGDGKVEGSVQQEQKNQRTSVSKRYFVEIALLVFCACVDAELMITLNLLCTATVFVESCHCRSLARLAPGGSNTAIGRTQEPAPTSYGAAEIYGCEGVHAAPQVEFCSDGQTSLEESVKSLLLWPGALNPENIESLLPWPAHVVSVGKWR